MNLRVPGKILLAEDEGTMALIEKAALESFGYSVVIVASGEAAVAAVESDPEIALVLMDVDFESGIDGTDAAELILKKCDLPIVFLSSHTDREIVEKTERITSYGYVVKNSSHTVLDASIKMAFKLFDATRKLRDSRDQLLALSTNLADGMVYVIDTGADGITRKFEFISPAVERMHGVTVAEAMADPSVIYDQVLEEDRELLIAAESEAVSNRTVFNVVVRVRPRNGEIRWRNFISSPRRTSDGRLLWDGIEIDVTERRRVEDRLNCLLSEKERAKR